ncbi:MAG: VCBS repeat-containing protein [Azoarcus sp.]|jgi:hypothetical protein|nr:VCBS repeat-containing protein [Azoarcus sp.]
MKITQSQLEFSTSHFSAKETRVQEHLRPLKPNTNAGLGGGAAVLVDKESAGLPVQISDAGRQNLQAESAARSGGVRKKIDSDDPKLSLLRMAVEMLTGKKIDISNAFMEQQGADSNGDLPATMTLERHSSYTEMEASNFAAQGSVRTADGQEINFQMELSMFRFYHAEEHVEMEVARPQDPLVLNFAGTAAELSGTTFKFDLSGKGTEVDMRGLNYGSGFLAFDRNGDGKVNDGRELFGTSSGNGFADLAKLDSDGNGWIDEGDSAFKSLYVWNKDADGNDVMTSLAEAGVGAIGLVHASTPFSLKDANNKQLGQITDTGVFLMEKGGVGTVQKVDVVV